ncbi:MAG: hypothetical protein U0223_00225 [Nitrospira sp.]|nr:hypothetical protein [Nitrospira sp.]
MNLRKQRRSRYERGWWVMLVVVGLVFSNLIPMLSRDARAERPDVKLDCTVYETKETNFGIGLKVSYFFFNTGPEFSVSRKTGIAWDKIVHGTIARYVELCNRYNAGLVTKSEYDSRLKEIDGLYKETKELEAKLYAATRQRARDADDELDDVLGRSRRTTPSPSKTSVEAAAEGLADRVEQLEPISQPLKPSRPCKPPDMLGAPGRAC